MNRDRTKEFAMNFGLRICYYQIREISGRRDGVKIGITIDSISLEIYEYYT